MCSGISIYHEKFYTRNTGSFEIMDRECVHVTELPLINLVNIINKLL